MWKHGKSLLTLMSHNSVKNENHGTGIAPHVRTHLILSAKTIRMIIHFVYFKKSWYTRDMTKIINIVSEIVRRVFVINRIDFMSN